MPPNLPPLRTFEADIADSLREKQASVMHIALAEQERARDTKIEVESTSNSRFVYGMSFLFLLVAIGVIVYIIVPKNTAPIVIAPVVANSTELISTTEKKLVFFDPQKRAESLALLTSTSSISNILGTVTRITPYTEEVGQDGAKSARQVASDVFLRTIFLNSPDVLQRSLNPDFALLRVAYIALDTVLVFKASDYERTVVGLNSWERTIVDDFNQLFGTTRKVETLETYEVFDIIPATSTPVFATSTRGRRVPIVQFTPTSTVSRIESRVKVTTDTIRFESSIRKNIEIKSAVGASGKTYLVYGFPVRDVLVIAQSLDAFLQIADMLKSNK